MTSWWAPLARRALAATSQTTVVERVGVAVVVRVPGTVVEKLAIGDFCLNQQSRSNYFQVPVENTGNVLAKRSGKFTLESEDGQRVFERTVDLGSVMPGGKTVIRVHAPQDPAPGKYVARVTLDQVDGPSVEGQSKVTVPKTKANGCGLEIDQPNVKVADESAGDNFSVPGAGSLGGGGGLMVLALGALVVLLAGALTVAMLRGRGRKTS